MTIKPGKTTAISISLGIFVAIFIIDLMTPLGYSHWILYIFPILIIYLTQNPFLIYSLLVISVPALIIGFRQSPLLTSSENIREISAINRITGFLMLLIFSIIIDRLIQARKRFKKLSVELAYVNKELDSFAYSAAHDLKAPLHAMKGFCRILLDDYETLPGREAKDYLKRIGKNSDRMAILIDDMLSLSKISLHGMNIQEVDISAIIRSIFSDLSSSAPQRVVEIEIPEGIKARADANLIKIALENLVGNAWKYTSKKQAARIRIESKHNKAETIICISDNGCGFDMKLADRLFVPFKRLHTEGEFQGTGIGLSIVDRVIRRHGGRIWGEGEVGKGAVFCLTLPR